MTTGKNRIMISRAMSGSVLGGDHTFGAFALALVVRPVPGRALLLGGKLGFELLILAFSVATTSVTGWPRGDRADKDLLPQLVEVDRKQGSAIISSGVTI